MSIGVRLWLGCAVVAALLQVTPGHAYTDPKRDLPVVFPLASADSRIAASRVPARADAVIRSQACGQEPKYAGIRAELEDEEYDKQGEGFTNILIAKIQWLRTQLGPCEAKFVVKDREEQNPTGSDEARLEAFMRLYFNDDHWRDPAVNCSAPTSQVATSIVTENDVRFYKLIANFHVERDCLRRQVNEAIRLMKQDRRMGTEVMPFCLLSPSEDPSADFDMTVKEVVRILYLSGAADGSNAILDPDTVAHMYEKLLPARGGLGPATFNVIADCADTAGEELGTPEDYADRQDLGGDVLEALEDTGEWLLNFMAKVIVLFAAAVLFWPLAVGGWALATVVGMEDPLNSLANAPYDVRIPETENHRLMIESSRYLTNMAIVRDLRRRGGHDNLDVILEQQNEVREWLLQDLQRIMIHDFDEYNSRPYTRLSLEAIQNLHDFANDGAPDSDPQMQAAARIVLDLSSAKFAAGSNRGRRMVPYRRLAAADGSDEPNRHLYHVIGGADHEVTRQHLLAGQTQLMEWVEKGPTEATEVRFGAVVPINFVANMVNTATSTYRLPVPIMEVATERILPFEQVVKHDGLEIYYAHPAYTMSVGGVRRDPALSILFGALGNADDRGIAMPTNLIPTLRGTLVKQTFQFQGKATRDERVDNICGWRGFICGIKPVFADMCLVEDPRPDGTTHHFVNSAFPNRPGPEGPRDCVPDFANPGPHFFLAAKTGRCDADDFCPDGQTYGIMEMVEVTPETAHSQDAFRQFREDRAAALTAWQPSRDGDGTYRSKAGDTIEFRVAESNKDDGHSRLWKVNGELPYTGLATDGAVIKQLLPRGKASITSPWSGARIDIDFSDWRNPRISDVPAPPGGRSELYRVSAEGNMTWYTHWSALGPQTTELPLQGPKKVAVGWDKYVLVTAAINAPVVYAMDAGGDLFWFRHLGYRDGSNQWLGPVKVGNGWTAFDKIIAGENGVIYGRLPSGDLRWHRHLGQADGSMTWTDAHIVGTGWQDYVDILAGSDGVLYGIKPDGDLIWHRHMAHEIGAVEWLDPARRVGNGWHTLKVRSVGRGVIYALTQEGELLWYRHRGYEHGEPDWASSLTIDGGWRDFKHVFALSPGD